MCYVAQDVIELQRIKVLADAGVPLARVRQLIDAEPDELRATVNELDAELRARIRTLQRTRRSLAELADGRDPFLPPEVAAMHQRLRTLGVSEATLAMERDAWVLVRVLYPDLVVPWLDSQNSMLDDSEYRELYVLTDRAFGWAPNDPRIEEVAQRTVNWVQTVAAHTGQPVDSTDWDADTTAYRLVVGYRRDASPGWCRLMERVDELLAQLGHE